eukprot:gb/GFBE01056164.1/.p1 GENE.gb/GFBE01056164.1/~~gb/GFBE01056164.1/.p1  ORF type:complete len:352 (+),score=57.32 gb/GFBE01056164.1/:1-1056(+)
MAPSLLIIQTALFLQACYQCSSAAVQSPAEVGKETAVIRRQQDQQSEDGSKFNAVPGAPAYSQGLTLLQISTQPPDTVQLSQKKAAEDLVPQPLQQNQQWNTSSFLAGMACGVLVSMLTIPLLLRRSIDGKSDAEAHAESASSTATNAPAAAQQAATATGEASPEPDEGNSTSASHVPPSEFGSVENLHLFWPRLIWLATMLMLQSVSSFILSHFQHLVEKHDDLIFYLTMLVGLGGNAGGQSVVLTCRKLALNQHIEIVQQMQTGLLLGLVLGPLAFLRGLVTRCEMSVCVTIGLAALFIAVIATGVGTTLPKLLYRARQDPGQAASMIQVIMDISGIMITCLLGAYILQ